MSGQENMARNGLYKAITGTDDECPPSWPLWELAERVTACVNFVSGTVREYMPERWEARKAADSHTDNMQMLEWASGQLIDDLEAAKRERDANARQIADAVAYLSGTHPGGELRGLTKLIHDHVERKAGKR